MISLKRKLLTATICITSLLAHGQQGKWALYPSYSQPVQVKVFGNFLYSIATSGAIDNSTGMQTTVGNLVRYDLDDASLRTFDSLNSLSSTGIRIIDHNENSGNAILIYSDNVIDLLAEDGSVMSVPDLKAADITINSVYNYNHIAYLCTNIGIVELDCINGVLANTYKSPYNVQSMCIFNDRYYIACSEGLYVVKLSDNLYDKSSWQQYRTYAANFVTSFCGNLLVRIGNSFITIDTSTGYERWFDSRIKGQYVGSTPDFAYFLVVGSANSTLTVLHSDLTTITALSNLPPITSISLSGQTFWTASPASGVIPYTLDIARRSFEPQASEPLFVVNSPRRDTFWRINFDEYGRLLAAGGINTQSADYYPETVMLYTGGVWKCSDEQDIRSRYPNLSHYNTDTFVSDPSLSDHFFAGVYRNGLQEYRLNQKGELELVDFFNYSNSPIRVITVVENIHDKQNYCTCTSLVYDGNGNLWMANQQTDTIVRIRRPNGQWLSLYYEPIKRASNIYQILPSTDGISFLVSNQGTPRGFFGFDTAGTLNYVGDDTSLLRSSITNQDGTVYSPTFFYCMTKDEQGMLWCGTSDGLFVVEDPSAWFDSDFRFTQIKRNRDDGSGLADYLLSGIDVTCITVDAANRKWIGTKSDGVYLLSPDGQETIYHFTADTTPLLSDQINDIAIDPHDGNVFIATDRGLCSYMEEVAKAQDKLDEDLVNVFPNPVRPSTNSVVTIDHLEHQSDVKILSASGQCVYATQSQGGVVRWNLTDSSGTTVSSGVYHVVINSSQGKPVIIKRLVVVR